MCIRDSIYTNIVIVVLGGALFGYWYFLDGVINPIYTYASDPMNVQTDKKEYHRGETIHLNYEFCKLRRIPAKVTWTLVDGQVVLFSPVVKDIALGCYGKDKPYWTGAVVIPENVPTGVWHLEGMVEYQVNPVKTISSDRKTNEFTIIE